MGTELRPGARLAEFSIEWVVLEGPENALDEALVAQLDLAPLPLDPDARVFHNAEALPLAGTRDLPWDKVGVGYEGEATDSSVPISVNYDDGWSPDAAEVSWFVEISGAEGSAGHAAPALFVYLSIATIAVFVVSLGLVLVGRLRS